MRPTIQSLLQEHFPSMLGTRRLSRDMLWAAVRLRDCRTAALGGHLESCPHGHVQRLVYNSCRHRSCPQCSGLARARWLAGWQARLLDCPHYHTVFTTPHELLEVWRYNKRLFADLLFASATGTLKELLADPKYCGATVGLLAALHTWSQTLAGHVHLHVLVTGGGLDEHGRWRAVKKRCLLPRKVLMIKFRGRLRSLLLGALARGELKLPPSLSEAKLRSLLNRVGRTPWNVKILERYAHGSGVATYLARYLKGGPISNARLVAQRDDKVYFRYREPNADRRSGKRKGVTHLRSDAFLQRLLEHVPPRRFQTVRGYGLYCGNQHSRLAEAHAALGGSLPAVFEEALSWEAFCESAGVSDAGHCPTCGARLVVHDSFGAGRSPPLTRLPRASPCAGTARCSTGM